jgi:maltokinase
MTYPIRPSMVRGDLVELIKSWLPGRRWFPGSGSITRVERIADNQLVGGDPELRHLLVQVHAGEMAVSYQVLVGLRTELPCGLDPGIIGQVEDGRIAFDALYDPELLRILLTYIAEGRSVGPLRFTAQAGMALNRELPGRLLAADQSNTSVVFGDQAILKVIRQPQSGQHPDFEIPAALTQSGSPIVAAPLGRIDYLGEGEPTVLAVLSRYFPEAATAWDLATTSVGSGGDSFARAARALGETTGLMHVALARDFGVQSLSLDALADISAMFLADLDEALAEVPPLHPYGPALRACYRALGHPAGTVMAQRVHGDLHLGQILGTRWGWVVIDFEGEPLIPLARRRARAPAVRDVATMLRSFDYAGRQASMDGDVSAAQNHSANGQISTWVKDCSEAFCDGYASECGTDPRENIALLNAFVAQKAVYETVYEARHRPSWLPIPIMALENICG